MTVIYCKFLYGGGWIQDLEFLLPMAIAKEYRPVTIQHAWLNLASDVLLLAIEDARQTRDPRKQDKAEQWLLSPAAKLFFDSFDFELDIEAWVLEGCPQLQRR